MLSPQNQYVWKIGHSKILLKLSVLMYGLVLFSIWNCAIGLKYQIGLSIFVLIDLNYRYYRYQLLTHYRLVFHPKGQYWQLAADEAQNDDTIEILPSTVLTSQLILLHYRLRSSRLQTMLIVKDALTHSQFRNLVTMLKINAI